MKNRIWKSGIMLLAAVLLTSPLAFAGGGHGGGSCSRCGGGWGMKQDDFKSKFFFKAHMLLESGKELGLSEDQLKAIRDLKIDVKKSLIRQEAEIDVLKLEIMNQMYQEKVDAAAVNKLIDEKYELKKAKTKGIVDALLKLKGMLSAEQLAKAKELYGKVGRQGK